MGRLALKVNDGYMDMGSEVVNLTLLNPALNDLQSHSLPFKIPLSKNNIDLLGLLKENSYSEVIEYDAEIEGSWRFKGRLKINKAGGKYEAVLRSGNGAFVNMVKGVKLTDLEGSPFSNGDDDSTVRGYLNTHEDDVFPDADYTAFCVLASGYVPESSARFFNDYNGSAFIDDADNLKPFIFIGKLLELIFGQYGYGIVSNSFRTDSDFRAFVLFHCNEIDWSTADTEGWKTFLPDVLINDLLKTLRNKMNVVCYVDDLNKTIEIRHFDKDIDNSYSRDITSFAVQERSLEFYEAQGFRLTTDNDNAKFFELEDKDVTEINTIDNLPTASGTSDIIYVKNIDAYYKAVYDDDSSGWGWELLGSRFNKPEAKSDNDDLSCKFNHLPNVRVNIPQFDDPPGVPIDFLQRMMPKLEDNNVERISIVQYLGLVDEISVDSVVTPQEYPLGTMGYRDQEATQIADVSLSPDDSSYGLRSSFWTNTEIWYSLRKRVTRRVNYTPEFLSAFKFYNKYRIDGQDYIIDKIELQLDFGNQNVIMRDSELISA